MCQLIISIAYTFFVDSNTNMGIPGQLSGTQLQKENVLSAATLVANISDPAFDGTIKYNKDDDGDHISGFGVKVFAAGERNPFGLGMLGLTILCHSTISH